MDRKHWLSPKSQLYTTLACYKSQFVSWLRRDASENAGSHSAQPEKAAGPKSGPELQVSHLTLGQDAAEKHQGSADSALRYTEPTASRPGTPLAGNSRCGR